VSLLYFEQLTCNWPELWRDRWSGSYCRQWWAQ